MFLRAVNEKLAGSSAVFCVCEKFLSVCEKFLEAFEKL